MSRNIHYLREIALQVVEHLDEVQAQRDEAVSNLQKACPHLHIYLWEGVPSYSDSWYRLMCCEHCGHYETGASDNRMIDYPLGVAEVSKEFRSWDEFIKARDNVLKGE